MKKLFLIVGSAFIISACSSSGDKYAGLQHLSETERNEAFKECFSGELAKAEKQDCISRYAPAEVGYRCEVEPVTGSRFGRRVCSTQRQRDADRTRAKESVDSIQRNAKALVTN